MVNILLVEDDPQLSQQIQSWLVYESHQVKIAADGPAGLEQLNQSSFDLVILDWVMPGLTGVELCRKFRQLGGQTPILMLSGKQEIAEKAEALDAGADDYLSKPFHPKELSARLNALLRRSPKLKPATISFGGIDFDTQKRKVFMGEEELSLPPKELFLLELFFENPGRAFTAHDIVDKLWPADSEVSTSIVKVYINKLRKRLKTLDTNLDIRTSRGAGYFLSND